MKWFWLLLSISAAACASQTQGELIELHWQVQQAQAEQNREFVTDTGWHVQLDEAKLALEAVFALAPERDTVDALASLERLFVSVAHAHDGHDEATGRRVRAEWTAPLAIDALEEGKQRLGSVEAEAGRVDLMKLEIARQASKPTLELQEHPAYLRGRAERDGTVVEFEGGLAIADTETARRVDARADFELSAGGTITLGVHVNEWLRDAAFERLAPNSADEPASITNASQVGRAWLIGVRNPAAFALRYTGEE